LNGGLNLWAKLVCDKQKEAARTGMVEKNITSSRNVVDFARYQKDRDSALSAQLCRHCGAPMLDGENEDECSSAPNLSVRGKRSRRFRAD
jgi:hypothetical protein